MEENQSKNAIFVDEEKVDSLKKVCYEFSEFPPSLSEISGDNEHLNSLSNCIHSLLSVSDDTIFPSETLSALEFAIRTFSFNLHPTSSKDRGEKRKESNDVNFLTKELADAREDARIVEEKAIRLEKENKRLKDKLKKSQSEGNDYFEKCSKSDERVAKIRRENAQQQKELKKEIDALYEEKQSLIAKLKTAEFSEARLTKSLDLVTQENAQLNAELVKLRSKSEAVNKKLHNAVENVSTIRIHSEELEAENQRLITDHNSLIQQLKDCQDKLLEAGPENVKNLEEERDGYKETVEKLQQELDDRTQECVTARREQLELSKQLDEREEEILEGKEIAEKAEEENSVLKSQIQDLTERVEEANHQAEQSRKDMTALQSSMILKSGSSPRKTRGSSIMDSSTILKSSPSPRKTRGSSVMDRSLDDSTMIESTDEDLLEQNKRLVCIIENELRFLSSSIFRDNVDTKLLSPDASSQPLNEDQSIIDNFFVEIARTKQFIRTVCKANQEKKMSDDEIKSVINELRNGEDLEQREAFALIALLSENNEVLRRYCDTVSSQNQRIISQVSSLFDAEKNEPIEEMIDQIVDHIKDLRQFTKKVQLILNGDFDSKNIKKSLEFITKYCQGTSSILRDFDTRLRKAIHFDGELADMPEYASKCYDEIKNMMSSAKEEGIKGTRAQMFELRREMDNEREMASDKIAQLEKEKESLENEKAALIKNIENLADTVEETENKLKAVKSEKKSSEEKVKTLFKNYNKLEEELEEAKKETEEVRKQMNQKQSRFEERLDAIITDERKQHTDDLLHFEQKLKAREERLKLEINTKSQNLSKTKQKLKQVIEAYDKAFRQQKETTAALRQQNNELIERLKIPDEKRSPKKLAQGSSAAQVEKLKARLRTVEQEKELLATQLEESELKAVRMQATCSREIEERMLEKETEIDEMKKEDEERRAESENKLISDIAESLSPLDIHCDDAESVLCAVREVVRNLSDAEKEIEVLKKNKAIKSMPSANSPKRTKQINDALKEWDRWARDLYVNVTDGQVPKQSTKDLRYALSEMVLASIGHRKLLWRLESLRTQKKALMCGTNIMVESTPPATTKATILSVIGAIRILRKAGRFQSLFN